MQGVYQMRLPQSKKRTVRVRRTKRNPRLLSKIPQHWWKAPTLKNMAVFGFISALFMLVAGMLIVEFLSRDLPSLEQLETYRPRLITKIMSHDNAVLKELYTEHRVQVPLDSVSQWMTKALISTEDQDFYNHWGISPIGIMRAVVVNTISMSRRQGASTITQQLARDLYLNRRRTYTRKIREAITAIQIERTYSKDEILQMFYTQTHFGHGAYGVQSAANRYFGVNASELTISQAAILTGLLKAPRHYSPFFEPEACIRRRNVVLNSMYEAGFLTNQQLAEARSETLAVMPFDQEQELGIAPYFTEEIRKRLETMESEYGFDYYRDGLVIRTTLDTMYQRLAEAAIDSHIVTYQAEFDQRFRDYGLRDWLEDNYRDSLIAQHILVPEDTLVTPERILELEDSIRFLADSTMHDSLAVDSLMDAHFKIQIAFIALDPTTGDIRAMVGGRDFTESHWNRAVQMQRQPGSVFKPIVYTTAIDNGIYANHRVLNMVLPSLMDDGTWWRPENYSTNNRGSYVSLRNALRQSLNNVTVRLVAGDDRIIPVEEVVRYAHRMGIRTELSPVPSLALGSIGVIPIDIVTVYSVFATGGSRPTPRFITSIEDSRGTEIATFAPHREIVLSPETAYIMEDLLSDVVNRGTGGSSRWRYHFYDPAAGKTGTTNNFNNAWFVGFTPRVVAGVWIGFDDPAKSLGPGQAGSRAALPVWAIFMRELHKEMGWERLDFEMPVGVVKVPVCEDSGELAGPYCPHVVDEVFRRGDEPLSACSIHRVSGFGQ